VIAVVLVAAFAFHAHGSTLLVLRVALIVLVVVTHSSRAGSSGGGSAGRRCAIGTEREEPQRRRARPRKGGAGTSGDPPRPCPGWLRHRPREALVSRGRALKGLSIPCHGLWISVT
jgi:hypothetical protein